MTPADKSLALYDPYEMTHCTVSRESSRSEARNTSYLKRKKKKGGRELTYNKKQSIPRQHPPMKRRHCKDHDFFVIVALSNPCSVRKPFKVSLQLKLKRNTAKCCHSSSLSFFSDLSQFSLRTEKWRKKNEKIGDIKCKSVEESVVFFKGNDPFLFTFLKFEQAWMYFRS